MLFFVRPCDIHLHLRIPFILTPYTPLPRPTPLLDTSLSLGFASLSVLLPSPPAPRFGFSCGHTIYRIIHLFSTDSCCLYSCDIKMLSTIHSDEGVSTVAVSEVNDAYTPFSIF